MENALRLNLARDRHVACPVAVRYHATSELGVVFVCGATRDYTGDVWLDIFGQLGCAGGG